MSSYLDRIELLIQENNALKGKIASLEKTTNKFKYANSVYDAFFYEKIMHTLVTEYEGHPIVKSVVEMLNQHLKYIEQLESAVERCSARNVADADLIADLRARIDELEERW